jgi:hypothetical protein
VSYVITFLGQLFAWLFSFLVDLPLYVLSLLFAGLATVINDIPAPGFFSDAAGWIGSMPPLAAYLLQTFAIGAGLTMVLSAYTLRFAIRRVFFLN